MESRQIGLLRMCDLGRKVEKCHYIGVEWRTRPVSRKHENVGEGNNGVSRKKGIGGEVNPKEANRKDRLIEAQSSKTKG